MIRSRLRTARPLPRRLWTVVATAVLAVAAVAGCAVPARAAVDGSDAAPQRVLTVMPLGDSITFGIGSSTGNGYRSTLYDGLGTSTGARPDLVGDQHNGTMADPDNEGFPGYTISRLEPLVTPALARFRPDVVTLHIGTNDLNTGSDPAVTAQRLRHLLDVIYAGDPGVTVVVATLVPSRIAATEARIEQYNARIPAVVDAVRASGKPIELVSMAPVTTAVLHDDLHPNDTGYATMGRIFLQGVQRAR